VTERRAWLRYPAIECEWLRVFCLYPGRDAHLLNLSRGGALVETRERFSPGCWIQMKITTEGGLLWARAQVIRCEVTRLSPHRGATYRTALGFERVLTLGPLTPADEYSVPSTAPTQVSVAGSHYPESA
jgi:hypothetical protein